MILIISRYTDQSTSDVVKWLIYFDKKFIRINYEDIISGDIQLDINNEIIKFSHDQRTVDFDELTGFWYRRGDFNFEKAEVKDWAVFQAKIDDLLEWEERIFVNFLHYKLEGINSISSRTRNSVNKLYVLDSARRAGLAVPETIVTNKKSVLIEFLSRVDQAITKPLYEIPLFLDEKDGQLRIYTEIVEKQSVSALPNKFGLSLFQSFVDKIFEIRVFYLNGNCSSMAIFSQQSEQTKVDFRKYDPKKPNRCTPFKLPDEIEDKLRVLMKSIKLNSGSIDLVMSEDHTIFFLEVNPIGQFGMTSYPCNYPIEKQIALNLINE